jgi:guanosine-3',5'-bis(diphosphate) 3'-pyrophosphohydrolase
MQTLEHTISADGKAFFDRIEDYLTGDDLASVRTAFYLAEKEHGPQRRKSGELFFTHPLSVAHYIAEYQLDAPALIAALLHDVAEDTKVTIPEIEYQFGEEVARLVDGVTKLKNVTLGVSKNKKLTPKEIEDATLEKLLRVMTDDPRAVLIKLFDRLHNMRTIKSTRYDRQVYKARETLSVYAPLANRLGIWKIKNELQARALEVIDPQAYYTIEAEREKLKREHEEASHLISGQIFECLLQANLDVRNVLLDPENVYTVYQDLLQNSTPFEQVNRTMRLVVLLDDWPSCYQALGHLHQLWKPVPGTFDDYIAVPRDNLYRSLHTTVVHNNGQRLKIRLRTVAMNQVSEIGILARWLYKGTPLWSQGVAQRVDAFFDNITDNINLEPQNPTLSVRSVVEDLLQKQIRVYTPRGDAIDLRAGATAIDFAYAIHTGLGHQCVSAYVNDVIYPLNRQLPDGAHVKILKRLRAKPQRAWLDEDLGYIRTNYARTHARRWFRRLKQGEAIAQGRDLLQKELDMLGYPTMSHEHIAEMFDFRLTSQLYYAIGRADLLPTTIAVHILDEKWGDKPARELDNMVERADGEKFIITQADGRHIRLCGTCRPTPPDNIYGFLRKDGGVTVHKEDCHSLRPHKFTQRVLKLDWGAAEKRQARLVNLFIRVYDRPGLLFEMTQLMKSEKINIAHIHTPPSGKQGEVTINLTLEVFYPRQLVRILHQIHALANVSAVRSFSQAPPGQHELPADSLYRPE